MNTPSALGQAIGADLQFAGKRNQFALVQKYDLPKSEAKQISLLLSEIGDWIMSRRKALTKEERERIVRVVKAVVV